MKIRYTLFLFVGLLCAGSLDAVPSDVEDQAVAQQLLYDLYALSRFLRKPVEGVSAQQNHLYNLQLNRGFWSLAITLKMLNDPMTQNTYLSSSASTASVSWAKGRQRQDWLMQLKCLFLGALTESYGREQENNQELVFKREDESIVENVFEQWYLSLRTSGYLLGRLQRGFNRHLKGDDLLFSSFAISDALRFLYVIAEKFISRHFSKPPKNLRRIIPLINQTASNCTADYPTFFKKGDSGNIELESFQRVLTQVVNDENQAGSDSRVALWADGQPPFVLERIHSDYSNTELTNRREILCEYVGIKPEDVNDGTSYDVLQDRIRQIDALISSGSTETDGLLSPDVANFIWTTKSLEAQGESTSPQRRRATTPPHHQSLSQAAASPQKLTLPPLSEQRPQSRGFSSVLPGVFGDRPGEKKSGGCTVQ